MQYLIFYRGNLIFSFTCMYQLAVAFQGGVVGIVLYESQFITC